MQQDYMLRMIQQFGGFLAAVLKLHENHHPDEALEELSDGYGRFTGLSPSLIHVLSEEDLVQLLHSRGGIDPQRCWMMAELLREEAEIHDELGQTEESGPRFIKALRLYLEVVEEASDLPAVMNVSGLEKIIDRIDELDLPRGTRERTLEYLESAGRLDVAENVVAWSLDAPDPDGTRLADARAFYERLLRRSDADLAAAGMSRAEVLESQARLESDRDDDP